MASIENITGEPASKSSLHPKQESGKKLDDDK